MWSRIEENVRESDLEKGDREVSLFLWVAGGGTESWQFALHLTRLGYSYLSLKGNSRDASNNVFPALFRESIQRINPAVLANESVGDQTDRLRESRPG
jgi:hypothetical protein